MVSICYNNMRPKPLIQVEPKEAKPPNPASHADPLRNAFHKVGCFLSCFFRKGLCFPGVSLKVGLSLKVLSNAIPNRCRQRKQQSQITQRL